MNQFFLAVPYLGTRKPKLARALVIAVILTAPFAAAMLGVSWLRILDFALLYVLLALGLNLVVGFAGLLDLGYIAFYGVGAYVYAFLASPHFGLHLPFWFVLPLGATAAALAGICLGFPVLRLRGDYLAIVTLGFGEIVRIFLNNLNQPVNITNGPQGIDQIDGFALPGIDFAAGFDLFGLQISSLTLYYFVFLAAVVAFVILIGRLQMSRIGRAWAAIRDDEMAAKAIGINARNMKVLAFAMGATSGGVAGGMFAAFQGFISPESFSLMESIVVLTMVVFGGTGNMVGVVLGALLLSALPELLRHFALPAQEALFGRALLDPEVLRMLLYSCAMIFMMLLRPAGMFSARTRYSRAQGESKP